MEVKPLFYFILGALFFSACSLSDVRFAYPFYHASPIAVWELSSGKLLGAKPENDRRLEECKPVKNAEGKMVQRCLVMFYQDFEKLVADYKKTKQELIDCQRN